MVSHGHQASVDFGKGARACDMTVQVSDVTHKSGKSVLPYPQWSGWRLDFFDSFFRLKGFRRATSECIFT